MLELANLSSVSGLLSAKGKNTESQWAGMGELTTSNGIPIRVLADFDQEIHGEKKMPHFFFFGSLGDPHQNQG